MNDNVTHGRGRAYRVNAEIVPITLRAASEFVRMHHRHLGPTTGHKFSVGLLVDGALRGVAVASRPVSRRLDDGRTLEVSRICTLGYANACSRLYAAIGGAAKAMGYKRLVTYTLPEEGGSSLKASGFTTDGERRAGEWSVPSRARKPAARPDPKMRWWRLL